MCVWWRGGQVEETIRQRSADRPFLPLMLRELVTRDSRAISGSRGLLRNRAVDGELDAADAAFRDSETALVRLEAVVTADVEARRATCETAGEVVVTKMSPASERSPR